MRRTPTISRLRKPVGIAPEVNRRCRAAAAEVYRSEQPRPLRMRNLRLLSRTRACSGRPQVRAPPGSFAFGYTASRFPTLGVAGFLQGRVLSRYSVDADGCGGQQYHPYRAPVPSRRPHRVQCRKSTASAVYKRTRRWVKTSGFSVGGRSTRMQRPAFLESKDVDVRLPPAEPPISIGRKCTRFDSAVSPGSA
jgi:hypothetical protein